MKYIYFLIILFASCDKSYSFPDQIRYGYPSCKSCHVSPSGGGVLKPYGRGNAPDLSTFDPGNESTTWGYAEDSDIFLLGGDIRGIHVGQKTKDSSRYLNMLMQADIELAVKISKQVYVSGSAGYYEINYPVNFDEDYELEHRRYYLLVQPEPWMTLRVGKFAPFFGLMLPDHTVRSSIGQGKEVRSVEAGFFFKDWQFVASQNQEDESMTTRLAINLGKESQLGISAYNERYAAFAVFSLFEGVYDMMQIEEKTYFNLLGWEAYKGIHLSGIIQNDENYGLMFQWFPLSHVELMTKYQMNMVSQSYQIMTHYYF